MADEDQFAGMTEMEVRAALLAARPADALTLHEAEVILPTITKDSL